VTDCPVHADDFPNVTLRVRCDASVRPQLADPVDDNVETEWVLLTSGTTGTPKMVVHSVSSLTAPIGARTHYDEDVVWGTFYDIRRYGGLQIFLRFLLGRGSMVVGSAAESQADYLSRLAQRGVTHLTGTPTHWRRALMCPEAHLVSPRYVRLSGEIADQGILNALKAFFPNATVGHAFATTEAGVGFEVNDGQEGFPVSILDANPNVQMKIEDGCLWIRSSRTASGYLGQRHGAVDGKDGFVDTGDLVERRGHRFYFLGRRSGVINVGGNKVHPEEVEAVINGHPAVRMSVVRSKRSPITGALVVADVVVSPSDRTDTDRAAAIRAEILQTCREHLAAHKVPVSIRFVPALDVAAAGKLARHGS
jgi:acyl-coenzyme A synthetase/AMP-(fatty) acid ligase